MDKIAESGRQVIMYDQIGCGNSFVEGHPELFNADTWIEELIELRKHLGLDEIHLLGQSWEVCRLFGMLLNINQKVLSLTSFHLLFLLQNFGRKNKKKNIIYE